MPMAGSNATSQNVGANNSTPQNNNNNTTTGSSRTWELSEYELQRTPQEAVTDGTEIAVSPRALHSELMCPICLDMLQQTMTTKECLHRFCSECIVTALRSGNKECPTCRKKLISKRSLRPDPNFDMLISKIYPSRDEYDQQQQKALAKLSKSHNQLALASSIEEGMKAQSQLRKVQKVGGKGPGQNNSGNEGTDGVDGIQTISAQTNGQSHAVVVNSAASVATVPSSSAVLGNSTVSANQTGQVAGLPGPSLAKSCRTDSAGDNSSTSGFSEEVTEVELVFKPHPDMIVTGNPNAPQNQTRFIKTTANASVEHLAKYLGMRLALDSQLDAANTANLPSCSIYICNNGTTYTLIPQNQTLSQVCEKYWRVNKPLEMFFSWRKI